MAKYYIPSNSIKVYPTAFRDVEHSGDIQSHLNTEFNVTSPQYLSAIKSNQSFSYKDGDDMVLSIHGYTFKFRENYLNNFSANLNAYICLQQKDIPTEGTMIYNNYILVADPTGQGTYSTSLDAEGEGGVYYFYGLVFTNEDISGLLESSTSGTKYFGLQVKVSGVVSYQPLKLSTSEIRDGVSTKPITTEFTTSKLVATTVETGGAVSSGSLTASGLVVNGLGTIDTLIVNGGITSGTLTTNGNGTIGGSLNVSGSVDVGNNISSNTLSVSDTINADSVSALNSDVGFIGKLKGDVKNSQGNVIVNSTTNTFTGSLQGNASTADKLRSSVSINSTAFDGSGHITTNRWGYARDIKIASSDGSGASAAVSVNGSENKTLLLPSTIKATITGSASQCLGYNTTSTTSGTTYILGKQTVSNNTTTNYNSSIYFEGSKLCCGSLSNGTQVYTLPQSTGTLALTSDLPLVNDKKLTLKVQKGNDTATNLVEFTANSSQDKSATIQIPKFSLSEGVLTITMA